MRKILLVNGIVTVLGFGVDAYGVLNLNFSIALLGFFIGVVDLAVFAWMVKKRE